MALLPQGDIRRRALEEGWPHFQLVAIKFRNETVAVTNAPKTLEARVSDPKIFDGGATQVTFRHDLGYIGGNRQRAPKGQLGRDIFNIVCADPTGAWRERFQAGYPNRRIAVWWVFWNRETKQYMVDDLYDWYRGRCIQPQYVTDDSEEAVRMCTAKFGGPLLQLDTVRGRRATKADQRNRDMDDDSHDEVALVVEFRWGEPR